MLPDWAKKRYAGVPAWGWASGAAAGVGLVWLFRSDAAGDAAQGAEDYVSNAASGAFDWAKSEAFQTALSKYYGASAGDLADVILRVAKEQDVSPFIIAAIIHQESAFGDALTPQGPGGTGDDGHGHGLMQIDDHEGNFPDWLAANDWTDPYTNITKGVQILKAAYAALGSAVQLSSQIKGDGNVVLTQKAADKRGVAPGTYPDPRPLAGDALDHAALAAFNTGAANVLESLAAGLDADATTAPKNHDYSETALATVSKLQQAVG